MDDQLPSTAAARFREQVASHGLVHDPDADVLGEYARRSRSVREAALWPIAVQSAERTSRDLELLLHQPGAPEDGPDLALVFALFIYARHDACEDAQIIINEVVFGDHNTGLDNARIEPNVKRGDFDIDVLVAVEEHGPHPEADRDGQPSSLRVVREAAMLKNGTMEYNEAKLKRAALKSLGLTPIMYDQSEIERDPFALARRVIDDLGRAAHDELYPPR